jgi:hypothetical protein
MRRQNSKEYHHPHRRGNLKSHKVRIVIQVSMLGSLNALSTEFIYTRE